MQPSVQDVLEDLFGSSPPEVPVYTLDDAQPSESARPVATVTFTDAPTLLGTTGRRKKVPAGVGLLFPELMVA